MIPSYLVASTAGLLLAEIEGCLHISDRGVQQSNHTCLRRGCCGRHNVDKSRNRKSLGADPFYPKKISSLLINITAALQVFFDQPLFRQGSVWEVITELTDCLEALQYAPCPNSTGQSGRRRYDTLQPPKLLSKPVHRDNKVHPVKLLLYMLSSDSAITEDQ